MRLNEFFKERVSSGQPLVLVTVFDTAGSTYSKTGGQMIIDGEGNFCGMLSGGCLEGDLVERARDVMRTNVAQTATYDLGADDELWGLGVGCDGTMHVLLQPLLPEAGYQPFAAIADILNGGEPAIIGIVIDAPSSTIDPGASIIVTNGDILHFGLNDALAESLVRDVDRDTRSSARRVETQEGDCIVLYMRITPSPSLLILGAGPDSEPVVRIASELGWRCTVADHRPAYIDNRSFAGPIRTLCSPAAQLGAEVDLSGFHMALVMSHHLESDREYLQQLSESNIGYVGLLGPPGRRDRLLQELGDAAAKLKGRIYAPAGMMLGGRGPGPIALEIVAEMQRYLNKSDGP